MGGTKRKRARQSISKVVDLGPTFTRGGYNASTYCYVLSLMAAFSSVLPEDISWAENIPFFSLLLSARKSALADDWPAQNIVSMFLRVPGDKGQEIVSMALSILQYPFDSQQALMFTKKFSNQVMHRSQCNKCPYTTTNQVFESIITCSLNNQSKNLCDLLAAQQATNKCITCNDGKVRHDWQLVSDCDILIVHYTRDHNLEEKQLDRTKAPAVCFETLTIGGMLHTYKLCSVILYTPQKNVEPDDVAFPIHLGPDDRQRTGHYSCIQLESVSSAILHNDDELKRLSGFNVVAEYAGKIVLAFYMKVCTNYIININFSFRYLELVSIRHVLMYTGIISMLAGRLSTRISSMQMASCCT